MSLFTGRARATIVVVGIAVALAAGLAPAALAKTKPGAADSAATGVVATSTAPTPHNKNDKNRGGHRTHGTAANGTDPTGAPNAADSPGGGATAPPTAPAAPPSGDPATPPAGVDAGAQAPAALTGAPATPAPPAVHKGVIIATPQPRPTTAAEATDVLIGLSKTITVKSRSVTTLVSVPSGMPAAAGDEVSILFGFGTRQTQHYDPVNGNGFRFDFPAGDGSPRQENVAISLADFTVGGHYGFQRTVPIEAHYSATISPVRFTLINDCDFDLAGLFNVTNEVKISWRDERGDARQEFLMGAGQTRTVDAFAHTLTDVTARDGLQLPHVGFEELDSDLPIPPFHFEDPTPARPQPPLLPDSRTVQYSSHSPGDEFCNGNFIYATTVTLLTYDTL